MADRVPRLRWYSDGASGRDHNLPGWGTLRASAIADAPCLTRDPAGPPHECVRAPGRSRGIVLTGTRAKQLCGPRVLEGVRHGELACQRPRNPSGCNIRHLSDDGLAPAATAAPSERRGRARATACRSAADLGCASATALLPQTRAPSRRKSCGSTPRRTPWRGPTGLGPSPAVPE